jgi:hypothetical protein
VDENDELIDGFKEAVKVIDHLGHGVMKVFRIPCTDTPPDHAFERSWASASKSGWHTPRIALGRSVYAGCCGAHEDRGRQTSQERRSSRIMEHTAIPEPAGFADLSKAEQVRYLQALWDRIAEQPTELPVPESHLAVAAERLSEYRRDRTRARSAYDVLDRLPDQRR